MVCSICQILACTCSTNDDISGNHPGVHTFLINGEFAVQKSTRNSFGRIPHDQTIEVTENRDTKSHGGIVGITLNQGAVLRTGRVEYLRLCREMSGQLNAATNNRTKDAGKKRVAEDKAVVRHIEASQTGSTHFRQMINSSGRNVTSDISADLFGAHAKRGGAVKEFVRERLDTDGQKDFYAPVPKMKLKTVKPFDVGNISKKQTSLLISTRELFGCFLVISQSRNISLPELFKYSLGPVPLSIATPDSSAVLPCDSTWIAYAMAILQAIKVITTTTYRELAQLAFNTIVRCVGMSSRIHWVVDTYPEISNKNAEKDRRTTSTAGLLGTTINSENQRIDHQFKKSLRRAQFKFTVQARTITISSGHMAATRVCTRIK